MADQKKFLDAEGVKYLWSKLSLQDYPNNQTLMDVIEAIDETKADKTELPPATDEAHKVLTTNANGEVVWDDKLCYSHREEYQVHEGFTVPGGKGGAMLIRTPIISPIVEGETYIVNWDGQDIVCVAHNDENSQMGIILGNRYLFEEEFEDTGEPFAICGWFDYNIMSIVQLADTEEHICGGVKGIKTFYTPIDGHYIAGGVYPGSGVASTVIGAGKATGTGSVSVNAGESYGTQTFAEGFGTVHENSTWGHAEGGYTNVFGAMGHAEGYGTTSYGEAQHVQGRTNIPDEECKYAHIVGNGHTYGNFGDKSNAHTLDWEGNAWYQGDVYVGSTSGVNKDEGSVKLARVDELPSKVSQLENDSKFVTETDVEALYKKLNSNTILGFYCIEDVTVVVNGASTVYPANSNVEIRLLSGDTFEIIPTSDNSIMSLNAFPGALGTYYPWLEGVKQFSNILFDMNNVDFYSKWSQGNQGMYQVQFAQYVNCIFWSDNSYVADVTKRTNYTLYYTSQLPLCYSTIPDNTFKTFFLAFGVNNDPNWGNPAYRESFSKATWATQAFSYYGARTVGIFGHDSSDFNIVLPKDCRGLMYAATAIENAGTFDAINTTNFGAKSGSWREAFGKCSSLRNLYIKNLKVNLNISWSPINYDSINFIISTAANTNAITISVSPYTYNLLSDADFELAASKNITIELLTTNYVEDKRLNEIANKADKAYVDEQIAGLVDSAPDTLNTIGALATALQENKEVVDILNEAIVVKADKTYVDEVIANIPTESDVFIIDCPDGSTISHTFGQIMTAINADKVVYLSLYGTVLASLKYVADDNSFIEFSALRHQIEENQSNVWIENININNDNSFSINRIDLSTGNNTSTAILYTPQDLTDAQKAQARANLGISENINPEPVITNYEYTYNGDTSDGVYDWVLNGSGHKMYAKLGELPEGTMNIVGSEITVTNHTNSALTVHFAVTEEHLTRELSMYDGEMVAQATQTGFTQILQSVGYYSDYSSVLCICTRPGKYIVSFGGWVEWVDFAETGIYGFETRTWGGNEYTSHFTFTSTVGGSGGTSGTIGGTNSPVDYKGNEIQAFTRGICIGDSVTEGTLDHSGGTFNKAGTSYPAILKRLTGLDITNAGIAGATSKSWYETSLNSSTSWGDWVNNEWFWREPTGTSLDYSGYDFAIIHLGINDIGNMGDITIEELLVDYEANIYNIINKLKEHNNRIKIFLATIVPSYAPSYNENYKAMNNKIRAIVEATANVYLLDLNDLSNLTMHSAYNVWHPTAIGYVKMAEEIKSLISYIISQNLDDFKDIQLIGTDYIL